jgi:hypothetical protein
LKLPEDLKGNQFVSFIMAQEGDTFLIEYVSTKGPYLHGSISGMVHDTWLWIVTSVIADDGYGPMLYDLAMEFIQPDGYLTSSTSQVSQDAANVWQHYLYKRADIEKYQLPPSFKSGLKGQYSPSQWHALNQACRKLGTPLKDKLHQMGKVIAT